jgi:hypothetical protein
VIGTRDFSTNTFFTSTAKDVVTDALSVLELAARVRAGAKT